MSASPRVVCDASCLFEFLVDSERGPRVGPYLQDAHLHLPDVAFVETAHLLRRAEFGSVLSPTESTEALAYLLALDVEVWGFHDLAGRAWDLRHNVTPYDATYVALAEQIDATLITLDERLRGAPGLQCEVVVP